MTAERKAISIFEDYLGAMPNVKYAKTGAKILIDEIVNELRELPKIPYNEKRLAFWQEVKQEIQKL